MGSHLNRQQKCFKNSVLHLICFESETKLETWDFVLEYQNFEGKRNALGIENCADVYTDKHGLAQVNLSCFPTTIFYSQYIGKYLETFSKDFEHKSLKQQKTPKLLFGSPVFHLFLLVGYL